MVTRKSKKPLLITLAALAGILIATAAVALIARDRGGARYTGDADDPYPYFWTERNNGTITMTLGTGGASDGAWSLESAEGSAATVRVGKTQGGKTDVTVKPAAGGRALLLFSLVSGEERLAELSLSVMVELGENNKLAATVTDHRQRAFQSVVRGGEETGHPFTVRGDGSGLTIFVEEPEGYTDDGMAWEFESTNSMAASVSDIDVSGEGVTFRLEAGASGSAEVRVYSARENISYVFDVAVTGGEMLLTGSRWEPYETGEPEEDTERTETGEARENT